MFILRKKSQTPGQPLEFNLILGKSYNFVDKEEGASDFNHLASNAEKEGLYGFIVYNEGADYFPLYSPFSYYIMTSDGKTFSNITAR